MIRSCRTKGYNWDFDTVTGFFSRWGKTQDDNPSFSPLGPEILDLEISTICHGTERGPCRFCYKSNTPQGKSMSLKQFKTVLNRMPSNLTQIAFGIGDVHGNKELEQILQATRDKSIVPNITINGYNCTDSTYSILRRLVGSCAVSRYDDDVCFNTVRELTDRGLEQVNIHQLLSADTFQECLDLIDRVKTDPRLSKLNALVFLMVKQKGRAKNIANVSLEQFQELVDKALLNDIPLGFDSCSAPSFLKATIDHPNFKTFAQFIEPCEAFLFSSYCNVDGEFFPCSFCEGELGWETGIKVDETTDFLKDVWFHPRMLEWREKLLTSSNTCECNIKHICRSCPIHSSVKICH